MRINRLICLLLITGSGVYATYHGGNISYALFYLALLLPVVLFLYTVYVYIKFKIYQSIDNYLVVKGDWTKYAFIVANENFITFTNIKVNFLKDKSKIEAAGQNIEYSLLPSESERMETRLKCNYRGEYYVGVDSIEVTDFLYVFSITYPIKSKLKVTVLPRVVQLERLGIAPSQVDVKNPMRNSNTAQEELDTEVRKYYPGDSRKRIHWKASARMQELVSRKYQYIPKAQIVVFMDLIKPVEDELKVVITEDKIIECVLALTNYYAQQRTYAEIVYDLEGKKRVSIASGEEFNAFYKTCAKITFHAQIPIYDLIQERMSRGNQGLFCMVVTHKLSKELYITSLQTVQSGNPVIIIFISDDTSDATKDLIEGMKLSGITVYQIMSEVEIGELLTAGTEL
jgi:Uncharacterized conserved protein (some members contain a von Willebrand factor type A (vWA) domain)